MTNAELIKALFLKSSNFNEKEANLKQLQIASEWDQIEKRLQEPSFWYFINDSDKEYSTRIEYVFDLIKGQQRALDPFYTFIQFHNDLQVHGKTIDQLWKDVKDYFMTLDEWYQDRELYHLVGFLVSCSCKVVDLKVATHKPEMTKTRFKAYLRALIKQQFTCDVDDLSYGDKAHRREIRNLLLLFNIETLLSTTNADVRFPFDRFKNEEWDLEHIRAKADQVPKGKERKLWLDELEHYLVNDLSALRFFVPKDMPSATDKLSPEALEAAKQDISEVLNEIIALKDADASALRFSEFFYEIHTRFNQQPVDWVDDLGNLALLDPSTNKSYKDAIFPVKRARIIDNDSCGVFTPICTKNAFLKYYSKSWTELAYWSKKDANDYVTAIRKVLAGYLPQQGAANE